MMNKVTMRVFNFDTQTYDYCVEMNTTRSKVANMSLEMWNYTKNIATSFPMTLSMMYDVCKEMLANENNTANLGWFSCEIEWNVGEQSPIFYEHIALNPMCGGRSNVSLQRPPHFCNYEHFKHFL